MEKADIRKKISSMIEMMPESEMLAESEKICGKILEMEEYKSAGTVLSYMAMDREVNLGALNEQSLADGKRLFLPRTEKKGREMDFYSISQEKNMYEQMEKGRWGIWEPAMECPRLTEDMVRGKILVLVPGVAFSKSGRRLGHGMGFYDIYIERLRKTAAQNGAGLFLIGTAFSCQIYDAVEDVSEPHDLLVDFLSL